MLLLFIILVLVLYIPAVQTSLGNYATRKLNEDFGTNINIEKVGLQFNGDVEFKNIYIEDYKKDTLISIAELNTSILGFKNLYKGKLVFGDIDIIDLVFNIKTYEGRNNSNLNVFIDKFNDEKIKKEESSFLLSSSDVSIYNALFRLNNENVRASNLFEFEDLNINATNFLISGSNVSARINTLNFKDTRGLAIKNLMTDFSYTLTDMTFENLNIKTPNSVLQGDLKFSYLRENLKFFTDKVLVTASFKDSNVKLDELNVFYNEFGKNQQVKFNTSVSGTLNDLTFNNLKLNTSRNTRIYGDINFKNLFNKEKNNFYMNGDFKSLTSTYKDLKALLPNVLGASIPSTFDRLGKFIIVGNSQITTSKIIADLEMDTELGYVFSNLEIDKINDIDNAKYKGDITFEKFDFGTFLDAPNVGVASLDFEVKGSGLVQDNVNTKVNGDLFEIEYNNYNYKAVTVAGNVRNNIFDGNLIANDKNLKLNFIGLIDFSEKIHKYDFEAKVDYANLNALNFVKRDSVSLFRSDVKMNMNASNYDDASGRVLFTKTIYKNERDTYYFDEFNISSRFKDDIRFITIKSPDIIEGDLQGRFFVKDLGKLFQNSLGHIYTNYIPHKVHENQSADFNFKIYNKILEVVYPEIQLGKNTFIKGRVESDEKEFRLTFKSPKIELANNFADNIELQVDNDNPLFNTYLEVDSLKTKHYNVSKFSLINVTVNDTLFMRSEFKGGKRNNDSYNLSFYHTINEENQSVVGFNTSDVTIKNYKWFINEEKDKYNKIAFDKKLSSFKIDGIKVNHGKEEIRLSGFIKDSTQKDLKLNFNNVDLAKITPDIDSLSLAGNVNGKLDILQQNGSYLPNSTVVIDNLKVNDFPLGDFYATITGNETLTNYKVDAIIKDEKTKLFTAIGDIDVVGKKSKVDVDLEFDTFNLSPLNPLLAGVLTNIRGLVSGKAKVYGALNKPNIDGDLTLNKAGLGIPYLNVDYEFADNSSVTLNEQSFIFNKIALNDTKFNSKGQLNGALSHVNFSNWSLGLDITTENLLVLDTKETEDALYYGTGFMGGSAQITGPTDQLVINVNGETKEGTVFKIPLSDTESFGDNTYINFITKEQKEAREKGVEYVINDVKGVELAFDLDLTEDAEVEVIIDKETGHALKGRGVGGLLVEINTNGKFNMWGDFSVFEGVYNFAYRGLVEKEFTVQPGGTLAWNGDPLKATMNIEAIYSVQANPSPLLDNPTNRSIPVELNITLRGDLEKPEPTFSFDFPNVNSTIKSELNYRLESPEDKQNQALYLISTGAFSRGLNELDFSGTIAERLNGIINGIFSNGDSKLNIGLNYQAGLNRPDYQIDDRVGVTLQTQISDRVLINGKVGVPVGGAAASETVVAGDVEIDFLLNDDGTLTAQVFNRENSVRNFGEKIGYTQGGGLSYSVDFDTFKELIQNFFKKGSSKKKKEVLQENTNDKAKEEKTSSDLISQTPTSKK